MPSPAEPAPAATETRGPTTDPLFNPLHPDVIEDPYPAYRRLREQEPVYWHEGLQSWILSRFDDCLAVLRQPDLYTTDFRRIGIPTPPTLLSLQTLDPPDQTPLRHLGLDALRTQDMGAVERRAAAHADALLGAFADREPFDFIEDLADPFTLATICDLMGVEPPQEDDTFHRRNAELDQSMDAGLVDAAEEPGLQARAHFNALVETWLSDGGGTGVLGYVADHRDGVDVEHEVLVNSLRAFFHAGFEVPSRFLGNAARVLLKHPDGFDAFLDQAMSDRAVDELVRYVGPVHALSRACTRDTVIGGRAIAAGDVVVALIAAGNRDPARFTRPDELVLDRDVGHHLGFGKGVHSCLGQHVGRMEAKAVFAAIARRTPRLRWRGHATHRPTATLRGLSRLTVSFG